MVMRNMDRGELITLNTTEQTNWLHMNTNNTAWDPNSLEKQQSYKYWWYNKGDPLWEQTMIKPNRAKQEHMRNENNTRTEYMKHNELREQYNNEATLLNKTCIKSDPQGHAQGEQEREASPKKNHGVKTRAAWKSPSYQPPWTRTAAPPSDSPRTKAGSAD